MRRALLFVCVGGLFVFCGCELIQAFLGGASGQAGPDGSPTEEAAHGIGQAVSGLHPLVPIVSGIVGALIDRGQQKGRAMWRERKARNSRSKESLVAE